MTVNASLSPANMHWSAITAANCLLLDALPLPAAIVSLNGGRLWVDHFNRSFRADAERIAARADGESIGTRLRLARAGAIGQFLQNFLEHDDAADELDHVEGHGPEARHLKFKAAPLECLDGVKRCLVSMLDRTAELQSAANLRAEMLRDSLTGLPNRLAFTETIEDRLERCSEDDSAPDFAVLVIDLMRFSRINESMGNLAGDELLITFARRLMGMLKSDDVLARTGGNEFGLCLRLRPGDDNGHAAASYLQKMLANPFAISDVEICVGSAIGVALAERGSDGETLFRNAQFAVKTGKAEGRVSIYRAKEASAARRRFSLETELRHALDHDMLELAYQPLVDLKSRRVIGFEALTRWSHQNRGEVSPNEFIPVAEESGLIVELGERALEQAVATVAQWDRKAGERLPIYVGVNLSAIQMARVDVPVMVESALDRHGVDGSRLTLELTESAIVQDPDRAARLFERLKALDVTLAMDDFGTGFSNLASLQRLPIDILKIDRSFVTHMLDDADSIAIVRAVLGLADALGMKTTAEGIESAQLATTLNALGCDTGQGFHIGRPIPADDAFSFFAANRKD